MGDVILHLAPAAEAYADDGFVHCTAGDDLMLAVANRFYREVPGAFVALTIDPVLLTPELRWATSGDGLAPRFPHVYGPIDAAAVVGVRPVRRAADGTFTGYGAAQ